MNQNAFFDDLLLMYLYKKNKASTLDIETDFGAFADVQNVNNVICNRGNSTSYINLGYIDYDDVNQEVSITQTGIDFIESKYQGRR